MEQGIKTICVVGLGYVGLPLIFEFSKHFAVLGFDVKEERVEQLKRGDDLTQELSGKQLQELKERKAVFTSDPAEIKKADFISICVPTPVDKTNRPDFSMVKSAAEIVGKNLKKGTIVVFESTVYPGATEEICLPLLEKNSGMRAGRDFKIGYSPERVNPGDKEHTIDKIVKVVAGQDKETTEIMAEVYGKITMAGVHQAPNIKTAEAAKVIENVQRDLNIALMNELSKIFSKMGIRTSDVLAAAKTKWNFNNYYPGLVGGHCLEKNQFVFLENSGKLKTRTISDYFEEACGKFKDKRQGNTTLVFPINVNALSFNVKTRKPEMKKVSCLSKRPCNDLMEITTNTNQKIKVSSKHPLIVFEDNQFFVKHAKDLDLKDRLPIVFNEFPAKELKKIDIISYLDDGDLIKKTRVKPIKGYLHEYKKWITKKIISQRVSNFFLNNYLPLGVFLKLEKQGLPLKREEIYLVTGRGPSFGRIKAVINQDKEFLRLVGYYLSEGCITKDKSLRTRWSFNEDEKEYIQDLKDCIKKLGLKYSKYNVKIDKGYQVKVSNVFLAKILKDVLKCGRNCYEKAMPEDYIFADNSLKEELIKGLFRGDASVYYINRLKTYSKNGKRYTHKINTAEVSYFTISPKLLQQVMLTLLSLKITFSQEKNRPLIVIHGHDNLKKMLEVFIGKAKEKLITYFKNKTKQIKSKKYEVENGFLTVGIKSIKKLAADFVYSMEVMGTNTFITSNGVIVHNCIGVDPYYLTYKAEELGYHPEIILAGRRINDSMHRFVAEKTIELLNKAGKLPAKSKVLVMGLTFKENVPDSRNSRTKYLIEELKKFDIEVLACDPLLNDGFIEKEFGVKNYPFAKIDKVDAVIITVPHKAFSEITLDNLRQKLTNPPVLIDLKGMFDKKESQTKGFLCGEL